ncbi:transposase [Gemmiger formicilis]|uniref:Transposase n=1 Tax=Candidatus Pullichristensenella stercorigallinarum TaxID=2840909 RepID=A0A9D0ZL88_9FIRM|nr:transposase [Candidatus Pullichristensenella stercorigallinarum]
MGETPTYRDWTRVCTNNFIERLNREFRRCTRVAETFPMAIVGSRLRPVVGAQQDNMKCIEAFGDCRGGRLHCRLIPCTPRPT